MRDMEIVGVSKDARYPDLKREIPPIVYFHDDQGYTEPNWRRRFSCARTSGGLRAGSQGVSHRPDDRAKA